jgi:hypothetical protein
MVDRNRALKIESVAEYGSVNDQYPTETAPNSDGLDARAYFVQSPTSADSTAYVSRATGTADLTLTDANAGTKRAQDLVSQVLGAQAAHQSLLHMQHFLEDGGPADGFASGATLRVTYQGILPLTKTWYVSSASTTKIISVAYVYVTGTPLVATKTWTLYNATGAVARTMVDTLTRTGPLLTQVTRTWS